MAFCRNCGNQIADDASVCAACGAPVAQAAPQHAAPQQPVQQSFQQPIQPTVQTDPTEDRSLAWLSYLGIFLLIPLFARKFSRFCEYHVRQGAILFAGSLAYTIVTQIILAIINAVTPKQIKYIWYVPYEAPSAVYEVFSIIFSLASIFIVVLAIIGIVNSTKPEKKELPIIGQIKLLDPLMDKIYASLRKEK